MRYHSYFDLGGGKKKTLQVKLIEKIFRSVFPDIYFSKQRGCSFFTFGVSPIQRGRFKTMSLDLIFGTSFSYNFCINRSDPQADQVLAKGDVVKIQLGAHIDGFAAISGETIVIGATAENPVTGRRADVLKAAWTAAEAAMRTVKVGNKNWAVTEIVGRTTTLWDCKPVEGSSICAL